MPYLSFATLRSLEGVLIFSFSVQKAGYISVSLVASYARQHSAIYYDTQNILL